MALTRPSAAQLRSANMDFSDPLFRINKDQTGPNAKDLGLILERGSDTNTGMIWDESESSFAFINTNETGTTQGNVSISSYANLTIGTLISRGLSYPAVDGTVGQVLSTDGNGNLSFISAVGSPGGSSTEIQFNNNGAFAGSSNLTFDSTTLSVTGNISVTGTVDSRNISSDGSKLDGIEIGATADQTAGEILAAIKTVDGPDSGLDADTIDGNHSSAFATAAQGTLANSAVQPGDNISDLTNDSGYLTSNQQITFTDDITFNTGVIQSNSKLDSAAETLSTTAETAIYAFPYSLYGSAEFLVTALNGSNRHITKLLVVHNSTTAFATEYGSVFSSNELASYDVSITGSNVTLFATPVSSDTIFKIATTLIE